MTKLKVKEENDNFTVSDQIHGGTVAFLGQKQGFKGRFNKKLAQTSGFRILTRVGPQLKMAQPPVQFFGTGLFIANYPRGNFTY